MIELACYTGQIQWFPDNLCLENIGFPLLLPILARKMLKNSQHGKIRKRAPFSLCVLQPPEDWGVTKWGVHVNFIVFIILFVITVLLLK